MPHTQPNVVVLMPHDLGQHISPYGIHTVHTPSCERLAREGVTFRNSFCTSPLCSPSRASFFTGRYNHQNGVMGLVGGWQVGGWDLANEPDEKHLARFLSDAGYATVLCGGAHETSRPRNCGFGDVIGGRDARGHAPAIDDWLAARDTGRPFYLQVGTHEVHRGWDKYDTPPDDSRGVWMPPYLRDLPEVREEMAALQGAVRRYDEIIGRILAALDRHGAADDTIFVSTTDHGIDMPRAKGTFYDPGIEVVLQVRYPAGGWGAGRGADRMISNVDVLPTILDAAGLDVPDNVEGRSFLPLLTGTDYQPNEYVFAEKTYHDTYDPTRAVRSERFKYIRYFEVCIFQDLRLATIPRVHYFKSPEAWRRRSPEELYDLQADPTEERNLADDPEYADVKDRLRRVLADWMRRTDDPLLNGPVSSPKFQGLMAEFLQ